MSDPTREDLIALCEQASVPESKWWNRDSSDAQKQVGECWSLLRAGCEFAVLRQGSLASDKRVWWIEITYRGFGFFDWGAPLERDTFYLPTADRLASRDGGDWY